MDPEEEVKIEEHGEAIEDTYNEGFDAKVGNIATYVKEKYIKSKTARYTDEQRWLRAYRNYRGLYGPDVEFRDTEKSKIFVKVTKTKCLAAYGQLSDVLFGAGRFPLGIEPTQMPDGVAENIHFDLQPSPQAPQGPQEPQEGLKPGETRQDLSARLGPLREKLEPVAGELKEGPGTTQTQVTFHPATVAAKRMEKIIHDQLDESNASKHARKSIFECVVFGSAIFKGVFLEEKEYPKWSDEGEYNPEIKTIPKVSTVSIWNSYPDPDAECMEEADFFIERHKLSRSQLLNLKKRPHFRENVIDKVVDRGESYVEEWWEHQIDDEQAGDAPNRFEVLEYWGYVDRETLEDQEIEIPHNLKGRDQLSVNVWICDDYVLRVVFNPFTPQYIPYYAVPYEINPYSFFGIGVAENMDDTQTLMNGFMRMAVDNAALSGNLLIEIDEDALTPGQDLTVYPGKVFRRQSGAPGQAIFGTQFPNVSNENMQMFDKARQLADESTGLPSFAHGQTGVTGVGRTSSGISMLMSAAHTSIRTVVKNFDDYLLSPLGKALFHFNMQFNFDKDFAQGDLEVRARGTESLMSNEIRSQRLMQFLQIVQNPALLPFAKMDYILREIAKSMDLDPDKVTNSLGDAAIQAKIMQQFQATMQVPEPGQGQPQGVGGPPPVSDTSGGGGSNMGIGTSPQVGEQGFTGTQGGQGAPI